MYNKQEILKAGPFQSVVILILAFFSIIGLWSVLSIDFVKSPKPVIFSVNLPALYKTADSLIPPPHAPVKLSVVSGGFTTEQELKSKVASDPILSEAFAGCFDGPADIFEAPEDARLFLSFRRGNGPVLNSHTPSLIHKGEWMARLSCGKLVLLRCGNFASSVEVTPSETIDTSLLEEPEFPEIPLSFITPETFTIPLTPAPPVEPVPPPTANPPTNCCATYFPPVVPVPTPEPSVLLLTANGVLVLWAGKRMRRKK